MWGTHCCKTNSESRAADPFDECDGNSISIDSLCCQNNTNIECPGANGCIGNRGNKDENYQLTNDIKWIKQDIVYRLTSFLLVDDSVDMRLACGPNRVMTITNMNRTDILPPQSENKYLNNMDCTWFISAKENELIELTLDDNGELEDGQEQLFNVCHLNGFYSPFHLFYLIKQKPNFLCQIIRINNIFSRDFLSITDGSVDIESIEKTGSLGTWTVQSKTSNVTIAFTSDHMGQRNGFKIKLQFLKRNLCPKDGFLCANNNCLAKASQICDYCT